MSVKQKLVLYLHGFNSSPDSKKACQFKQYCQSLKQTEVLLPALPYDPAQAFKMLQELIEVNRPSVIVGSSLGGFYATCLAEQFANLKAVLVNPAVAPCEHLDASFLGPHKNYYTGEEYNFTAEHAEVLRTHTPQSISRPEQYLLLVQKGDEVLNFQHAVDFYKGSKQIVQAGGDHSFVDFPSVFPELSLFAGLE